MKRNNCSKAKYKKTSEEKTILMIYWMWNSLPREEHLSRVTCPSFVKSVVNTPPKNPRIALAGGKTW